MKLKMSQVLEDGDQDLQISGEYLREWNGKKAGGYCAIGLLACASGNVDTSGAFKEGEYHFIHNKYGVPTLKLDEIHKCPECDKEGKKYLKPIIRTIIHLNDFHSYTYKDIAKYLKKQKL